jgi:anti-sigma-K factor RskA
MNADADRLGLAAEYVLGTLDAAERDEAEALINSDAAFAAMVGDWERKLGELSAMVAPVSPPPELWAAIQERLTYGAGAPAPAVPPPQALDRPVVAPDAAADAAPSATAREAPLAEAIAAEAAESEAVRAKPAEAEAASPELAESTATEAVKAEPVAAEAAPAQGAETPEAAKASASEATEGAAAEAPEAATADAGIRDVTAAGLGPDESESARGDATAVVDLTRRMRRWRGGAIVLGALAAALAAVIVTSVLAPEQLPEPLRPRPEVRTVEVPHEVVRTVEVPREVVRTVEVPAPAPGRFVAVLQSSANAPAFIITVDVAQRNLTVRRVAAETQTDHSYELWLISNRFQEPRSLGLIGTTEFTRPPTLSAYDPETISDATFAVSLEPEGGSPTGQPTGPVLFSGKLVEAVPPTPAARTP